MSIAAYFASLDVLKLTARMPGDMLDLVISTVTQGLIYALISFGVYIIYSILDFPDLSVDGSFPLGAAVTAVLLTRGVNPYLTLPAAIAAGALAGLSTGLIHVKLHVRDLLAGIITMSISGIPQPRGPSYRITMISPGLI